MAILVYNNPPNNISDYFSQRSSKINFSSASWVILSAIEKSIKEKIEKAGKPLKDWNVNIYRGILTGYNEAFIIDQETRDRLVATSPKNAEIIRPILRGRDIKRYKAEWAGLYIITTFPSLKIDIEQYPAVKEHLLSFGFDRLKQTGELGARKKTGNQWFEVQDSISYWEDFYKQKIVWGNLNLSASYCLAEEGIFINAPCAMITPYSGYLLAILNSKLADYYIRNLGVTRNGGYFEYKPMFVEKLPLPILSDSEKDALSVLIQSLTKQNQHQIDMLVYTIYGLSRDEISFIESLCN